MNGEILNIDNNGGVILADDEKRYKFTSGDAGLRAGLRVNFELNDSGDAVDILPIKSQNKSGNIVNDSDNPRSGGILGAVGSGLGLLSFIPFVGLLFAVAALVTELIGVKRLSTIANRSDIFWNMVQSYIIAIVSGLIGFAIFGIGLISGGGFENMNFDNFGFFAIAGGLAALVMYIWSLVKYFKSLTGLASSYNISLFKYAAWCYVIAVPTMVIGIGLLLFVVFLVLKIVAYLSIKDA